MFEVIGYATLRVLGFGWLWGRQSFSELRRSREDVFGNGNPILFGLGLVTCVAIMVVVGVAVAR